MPTRRSVRQRGYSPAAMLLADLRIPKQTVAGSSRQLQSLDLYPTLYGGK